LEKIVGPFWSHFVRIWLFLRLDFEPWQIVDLETLITAFLLKQKSEILLFTAVGGHF